MFAFLVLLLILAVFGGGGFALNILWWFLIGFLILWVIGWFIGSGEAAYDRRRWYGRW